MTNNNIHPTIAPLLDSIAPPAERSTELTPKFKLGYSCLLKFNDQMEPLMSTITAIKLSKHDNGIAYDLIVLVDADRGRLASLDAVDECWLHEPPKE